MSPKRKALTGSIVLTAGEGVAYAGAFVRNMVLAHLLTRADFGVAATFAMVSQIDEPIAAQPATVRRVPLHSSV